MLRVQKLGVDLVRCEIVLADNEYFRRLVTRGGRLGGVHFLEELAEDPDETLIVLGAKDLGDEPSALAQELRGQLEGVESEEGLLVGVMDPILADVGGPVMENQVCLGGLQLLPLNTRKI